MQFTNTTALVTGASSGIGREFARALAERGADLVLVARRLDVLDEMARDITAKYGVSVVSVAADLSEPNAGSALLAEVERRRLRVDTVVNCAGIGLTADFMDSSLSDVERQLAINVAAVVDISHAFLPQLTSSGVGALVNVASLTAYAPTPGMAVYAASKAFVLRFTEALAYELRASGLTVMALSPGPTKSDFYRASNSGESGVRFETPEQVVATAFRAVQKRRPPVSVVSGLNNRLSSRIVGLLPRRTALRLMSASPVDNRVSNIKVEAAPTR